MHNSINSGFGLSAFHNKNLTWKIQVLNFARKFSPYCHQAGFLARGSSLSRLLTLSCNGILASLPIYSDRIAQDLHLIPFSSLISNRTGRGETKTGTKITKTIRFANTPDNFSYLCPRIGSGCMFPSSGLKGNRV